MTQELIIKFLSSRPGLNVKSLEIEAGISRQTLAKVLRGETGRRLNEAHINRLIPTLNNYGFSTFLENIQKKDKAEVIAVFNHKGGVGKTTTTINLARGLHRNGYRVLMLDLDGQANLSTCFFSSEEYPEKNELLLSALNDEIDPKDAIYQAMDEDAFDIIATDENLIESKLKAVEGVKDVLLKKRVLDKVDMDYDYIVLDCPPSLGFFTNCALNSADSVVIPVIPEEMSIQGLSKMIRAISEIRELKDHEIDIDGVLITMKDSRYATHEEYELAIRNFLSSAGIRVFSNVIRKNAQVAEAPAHKLPVLDYKPNSNGSKDYHDFIQEYIDIKEQETV
ncbi:chromosome partitioning protein ParA (plasmid) [Persicobacter psychrovividus]|uniref:Chromosome partitioning protein ParA n=1 Tax=Persicobacter psychrovividus TaxID=387638 RepID=A0ABM7VIU1_9BACT|nr:chromosome partitioning protein ParA [Persicobacter psychrovividus]